MNNIEYFKQACLLSMFLLFLLLLSLPPPARPASYPEVTLYLVPHSHTDPGWIETLEHYYEQQVSDILTQVVQELRMDPQKRFTWAETVYLHRYYH